MRLVPKKTIAENFSALLGIILTGLLASGAVACGGEAPLAPLPTLKEGLNLGPGIVSYTAIDVNKLDTGEANLLVGPTGKVALVDAGYQTMGDVVIIPYLLERGITTIDYLVTSHPHPDHIGGMPELLASPFIEIKGLYIPNIPWGDLSNPDGGLRPAHARLITHYSNQLLNSASAAGVETQILEEGDRLDMGGGAYIETLLGYGSKFREQGSNSLVHKFVSGEFSVLLGGDAGPQEWKIIQESGKDMRAVVLKIPHHMVGKSGISPYLTTISPRIAVGPTTGRLLYDQPTNILIGNIIPKGILLLTTATHNHITIAWTGDELFWRSETVEYIWEAGKEFKGTLNAVKNFQPIDLSWVQPNQGEFVRVEPAK